MRKLTVKNFSVIKDAELEFGKITVLIGPQSSGKSLLCKLAYFFQRVVVEQAEESLRKMHTLETFRLSVADQFVNGWFPLFGPEPDGEARYEDGESYKVSVSYSRVGALTSGLTRSVVELSEGIEACYEKVLTKLEKDRNENVPASEIGEYLQEIRSSLKLLQMSESEIYSYIPGTRSFFVTSQKALLGTAGRNDPFTFRFAQDFAFDFEKRVPRSGLESHLTKWINDTSRIILRGQVVANGSFEVFQSTDGREMPLSFLSSGSQELVPLLTCLREFVALSAAVARSLELNEVHHRRLFYVEEPEANIFPSSQHDLVRVFARMASEPMLDASWVLTTHSPYILSSFNNLLEAWQAGHMDEQRAEAVRAVIDEKYWVNPDEFRAYAIEDGVLKSIVATDTRLISDNYLDSVSETIGAEFDELLRIGYVEA